MKLSVMEAKILAGIVLWDERYYTQKEAKDPKVFSAVSNLVKAYFITARFDDDGGIVVSVTRDGRARILNPKKLIPKPVVTHP